MNISAVIDLIFFSWLYLCFHGCTDGDPDILCMHWPLDLYCLLSFENEMIKLVFENIRLNQNNKMKRTRGNFEVRRI